MTKEQFVAIVTEEGLTSEEAGVIWEGRPGNQELSELSVRLAARHTLPAAKAIRRLKEMARSMLDEAFEPRT